MDVDKPPKESLKCWNSGLVCKPYNVFVWIAHDAQSMHKLRHGGVYEGVETSDRRQRSEANGDLAESDGVKEGA